MSVDCFQNLDVTRFRQGLNELHELVAAAKGRIAISRQGCVDDCVLISKAELDSLERALQIFAETAEFEQMSQQIAQIVAAAGGPPPPRDANVQNEL